MAIESKNKQSYLVTGVCLVLAGAGTVAAGFWVQADFEQYQKFGVSTQAVVTKKDLKTETDPQGQERFRYVVDVEFTDRSSQKHNGELNVEKGTFDSIEAGKSVPVKYLPAKPANFILDLKTEAHGATPFLLVGALMGLGGVGTAIAGFLAKPTQ